MQETKTLIQIANRIQEALTKLKKERYLELLNRLKSFAGQLRELTTESRKMGASLANGWFSAAERCCSRASRLLIDIPYSVSRIRQLTEGPTKQIAKLSTLVDDLKQVQQEFSDIDFDKAENTISVVTEPITLDDVYLGPFKIELKLDSLGELYRNTAYHVIALDPNPAATDESVTHPHISNDQLCEGEGAAAIRAALEQGRVCDFFTMVRSILNTYNPDSAYVSLYDWDGTPCYDCGYVMGRENTYYCGFCDHDYCEDCSSYCRLCDETLCLGCGGQCPHCEEMVCPNCISRCAECEELCCKECLDEDICPNCKEERESKNEERENQNAETERNGDQSQPETGKAEVRLAS